MTEPLDLDALGAKLSDTMDPDNARAFVDAVFARLTKELREARQRIERSCGCRHFGDGTGTECTAHEDQRVQLEQAEAEVARLTEERDKAVEKEGERIFDLMVQWFDLDPSDGDTDSADWADFLRMAVGAKFTREEERLTEERDALRAALRCPGNKGGPHSCGLCDRWIEADAALALGDAPKETPA